MKPELSAESVRREFWACLDAEGTEFLCPYCGAIVNDVNLHGAWHEHQRGRPCVSMSGEEG